MADEPQSSLFSKIEKMENYDNLYKIFNYSEPVDSKEKKFEYLAFSSIDKIGEIIFSENWEKHIPIFRSYLMDRYSATKNEFAKCRYSVVLAIYFSHNISDGYNENLNLFKSLLKEEIHYSSLSQFLNILILIYKLIKKKNSILKENDIHATLSFLLKDQTIPIENRRHILLYITSPQCPSSLKISKIPDCIETCLEILNLSEGNPSMIKSLILSCITVCKKSMEINKGRYNTFLRNLWERFGDNEYNFLLEENEEDLIVAHFNVLKLDEIIKAYSQSDANEKLKNAKSELIYWKNKQIYPKIPIQLFDEKSKKKIKERLDWAQQTDLFLCLIGISSNFLGILPTNKVLDKISIEDWEFKNTFKMTNIDINGNSQPITEQELEEYLKFKTIGLCIDFVIESFTILFLERIKKKTLSFSKLKSLLIKKTILGYKYLDYSGNRQTLFDFINEPLKSLFKQLTNIINKKPIDFVFPLDTLGIKIERILRDILFINNHPIVKKSPKGKDALFNLDDILSTDLIKNLYSEDDLNFFKYILTNKGLNIRNNAAHGFYDDNYYKGRCGLLFSMSLLMCIIRLAINYSPSLSNNEKSQNIK